MKKINFIFCILLIGIFYSPTFLLSQNYFDTQHYHSISPFVSYAYPKNTFKYGLAVVVFGRTSRTVYENIDGMNKEWSASITHHIPPLQVKCFSNVIERRFTLDPRWIEFGAGLTSFCWREYRDEKWKVWKHFLSNLSFSAAYAVPLHGRRGFLDLRTWFPFRIPLHSTIFYNELRFVQRFSLSVFYEYKTGIDHRLPRQFPHNQIGLQLSFNLFNW